MSILLKAITASPMITLVYSPLAIAQTLVGIATPFATGAFIDALVANASAVGGDSAPSAICPFVILASLCVLRAVMAPLLQWLILAKSRAIELRLQKELLERIVDLPAPQMARFNGGELVAKLTRDAASIGNFIRSFYPRLLSVSVMMTAAGVVLSLRSITFAAAFVLFLPITVVAFIPFAKRFAANSHFLRTSGDTIFSNLFEFFNSLPYLAALGAERRFTAIPRESLTRLKDGSDATDRISTAFSFAFGAIAVAGEVAILGGAGYLAFAGQIPIGDVVVYQMLFMTAIQAVQGLIMLMPEAAVIREGVDSVAELLSAPRVQDGGARVDEIRSIECRDLAFLYPGSPKSVVRDFSMRLAKGTIACLVGENGAGKTTLLKLIIGALSPSSGEVLANGIALHKIDLSSFRQRIGAVFQDTLIFNGTIRENITLRDPRYTERDIADALAQSGLDRVVARLPQGLDTVVGWTSRALSGGERQRLAIARALIRKPDILVFDEVTNHLDAESYAQFLHLLETLRRDHIILLVSHNTEVQKICDFQISCQMAQ